jgi:hypothetical protein
VYFAVPGLGASKTGDVVASSTGGGDGSDFSLSPFFLFFLWRWRQKRISKRTAMRIPRPPITPPAIAPILAFLEIPDPFDGVEVLVEILRVAARAVKVGVRVKYTDRSGWSHADG